MSDLMHRARKRMGLTLDDLAEKTGIHRVTLCIIENRKRVPKPETIRTLANSLSIPEGDFYLWVSHSPEYVDSDPVSQ